MTLKTADVGGGSAPEVLRWALRLQPSHAVSNNIASCIFTNPSRSHEKCVRGGGCKEKTTGRAAVKKEDGHLIIVASFTVSIQIKSIIKQSGGKQRGEIPPSFKFHGDRKNYNKHRAIIIISISSPHSGFSLSAGFIEGHHLLQPVHVNRFDEGPKRFLPGK